MIAAQEPSTIVALAPFGVALASIGAAVLSVVLGARANRASWQRDQRRHAYAGFLVGADAYATSVDRLERFLLDASQLSAEHPLQTLTHQREDSARDALAVIAIVGPPSVERSALDLFSVLRSRYQQAIGSTGLDRSHYDKARAVFVVEAKKALGL